MENKPRLISEDPDDDYYLLDARAIAIWAILALVVTLSFLAVLTGGHYSPLNMGAEQDESIQSK